jgi:hypothetical protein
MKPCVTVDSFVHRIDNVQFAAVVVGPFLFDQRLGDHTDHTATRFKGGCGHDAHQAVLAAAVNELAAARANPVPDGPGCRRKVGTGTGFGSTVHTDGKSWSHERVSGQGRSAFAIG